MTERRTGRGMTAVSRLVLALAAVALAGSGALWLLTTDPHGVGSSPAISASSVDWVEPLYGVAWLDYHAVAWSPDARRIAVGGSTFYGETGVVVLDARTGNSVGSWAVPGLKVCIRWSPDGHRVAVLTLPGSMGASWVFLLNERGEVERSWRAHGDSSFGLDWSPDGTRIATAGSAEFAVWRVSDGSEVYRVTNAASGGPSVSWSPDGTRIALGGTSVYEAATGQLVWNDTSLGWSRAAWSPRGDLLASGGEWGFRLYRPDGSVVADLRDPLLQGWPMGAAVSWSPDGGMIAHASNEGTAIVSVDGPVGPAVVRSLRSVTSWEGRVGGSPGSWDVAWSPRGDAIAITLSQSHPSLLVWGVPGPSLGATVVAFGAVWLGAIGLAAWPHLRAAVRGSGREPAGGSEALTAHGRPLFAFAFASSLVVALLSLGVGRVLGLLPMPSLEWFVWNGALSALLALFPAVLAAVVFHRVAWAAPRSWRPITRAFEAYGYVLLPFVWTVGAALVVLGVALASGAGALTVRSSPVLPLLLGLPLGAGLWGSARAAQSLPGVRPRRTWIGLGASAGAFVGAFLAVAVLFVIVLSFVLTRVWRVPFGEEFREFGISIASSFGFTPFVVVLVAFVSSGIAYGFPALLRFTVPGYARLHGSDVLELESRRSVLTIVGSHPGVHFRELQRLSGLGVGTLHYHLSVLERESLVVARREGMWKRFYPSGHAA